MLQYKVQEIPKDIIHASVEDMVMDGKQWRWDKFVHLVPFDAVIVVASYLPPCDGLMEGTMYWRNSPGGDFSIGLHIRYKRLG